ncbi:MAG: EVE domain-containing protein [Chloroflexi bacterium]|nr:EVE domain-containing protein [Chloroflexota bacterium]
MVLPNYWIVVGSEENMRIAEARGFDIFGFKSTRRSEVAKMQPGDKLIFYLTKIMKFGGLAGVTSEYFEDHTKLFKSEKKPKEDYPFRVNVKPEIVLSPDQYLDVKQIAPRMQYPKKWPPEHWRLAFQGNLHRIPQEDYDLIVSEMKAAATAGA